MPVQRRRLTAERPLAGLRDDRPVFYVNCDHSNYVLHPNYRTGLGGGFNANFTAIRDLCLARVADFTDRFQWNCPKGRAGKQGDTMNPSMADDPAYPSGGASPTNPYYNYPVSSAKYADGTVITVGNTNIGSAPNANPPTFNCSAYSVDLTTAYLGGASTRDSGGSGATTSPPIPAGGTYLNQLYRDVMAAVRAVSPGAKFAIHDGLWTESMLQMHSSRLFDPTTDMAAYLSDSRLWANIGINERFIDAAGNGNADGGFFEQTDMIRLAGCALRMGVEAIPVNQHIGGAHPGIWYDLDLPKILNFPSWAQAALSIGVFWGNSFEIMEAPPSPYQECIHILFGTDSGFDDDTTITRMGTMYQHGFILGADNQVNDTKTNVQIVKDAMAAGGFRAAAKSWLARSRT